MANPERRLIPRHYRAWFRPLGWALRGPPATGKTVATLDLRYSYRDLARCAEPTVLVCRVSDPIGNPICNQIAAPLAPTLAAPLAAPITALVSQPIVSWIGSMIGAEGAGRNAFRRVAAACPRKGVRRTQRLRPRYEGVSAREIRLASLTLERRPGQPRA